MANKQMRTEPLQVYIPKNPSDIPANVPMIVDTSYIKDMRVMLDAAYRNPFNILFVGPKGTAKTLLIAWWAAQHKIPLIQFDCSEQTKRRDALGRFRPIGNQQIDFMIGDLARAIHLANKHGACILSFEEINALTPAMQKVLNQLLDWRRHVYIPEIGRTFRLKDDAKLIITATCNPTYYGGTFELNEDLRSRFVEYEVPYPTEQEERRILASLFVDYDSEYLDEFVTKLTRLAAETRNARNKNELGYALSTRDIEQMLKSFLDFIVVYKEQGSSDPETDALRLMKKTLLSKYDIKEREFLEMRWKSIMGDV